MNRERMLGWRIAISAILIPALVAIFYVDAHLGATGLGLLLLCEVLAIRGVWEMADLFRDRSKRMQLPSMFACSAALVLAGWIPHLRGSEAIDLTPLTICFAFAVMYLCALEAIQFREPGTSLETLGSEILIISYTGLLLAITAQLRWVAGSDAGYLVLGSLLVCTKGGDIGAYTIGRLFGKSKMAPLLSPGKTWAGAVGAIVGAGLMGWLWLTFAPKWFNPQWTPGAWYFSIFYGCAIGATGLLGDLVESLLKRDAGKKDSAALFPGFGGLLDLLDSVIYAGPLALLLWQVLPLATW